MSQLDDMRLKLRGLPALKGPLPDFDPSSTPSTPHATFRAWLDEAISEGVVEPHAMTLSTVDEHGWPDARVLLLKNVDGRGWHFAAKSGSPKGKQIENNPHAALTFYWPQLGRQVRLRGEAHQLPDEECAEDYLMRPQASRIGAIASKQSEVLVSPDDLVKSLEIARKFLDSTPDHVAPDWKVFTLEPTTVEFWQGATDRLHKRLEFVRTEGSWNKNVLWP
ncbi:pyridoxamine 5'-phosphate oxidase [Xylariales sp. PMI_506]|nr:pyridoxamine 5'-phosphate oxidase [Xylariales sp. PMI_506]